MKPTDKQVEILAVCAVCQKPLETEGPRRSIEGGKSTPAQWMCRQCTEDPAHMNQAIFELGTIKACDLIEERFEAAGLSEYFDGVAQEMNMRRTNQQN